MTDKEKQELEALNEELKKTWLQVGKELKAIEGSNREFEETYKRGDPYTVFCIKQGYYSGVSESQGKLEKLLDKYK